MSKNSFNFNESNKTERYLWQYIVLMNYGKDFLTFLERFTHKRVFLGNYETTKDAFFLVLDSNNNINFERNLILLLKYLKRFHGLHLGTLQNEDTVAIVLTTTLSSSQIDHFYNSDYSKIYKRNGQYMALEGRVIKSEFKIVNPDGFLTPLEEFLRYRNSYLILTKSESYFEHYIKPYCISVERSKAAEYDGAIDLSKELYKAH